MAAVLDERVSYYGGEGVLSGSVAGLVKSVELQASLSSLIHSGRQPRVWRKMLVGQVTLHGSSNLPSMDGSIHSVRYRHT